MLEKIYHSKSIINELRQGILGKHIDDFAVYFQELGYSKKNICVAICRCKQLEPMVN